MRPHHIQNTGNFRLRPRQTRLRSSAEPSPKLSVSRLQTWFSPIGVVMRCRPEKVLAAIDELTQLEPGGPVPPLNFLPNQRQAFLDRFHKNPSQEKNFDLVPQGANPMASPCTGFSINRGLKKIPENFFLLDFSPPGLTHNPDPKEGLRYWHETERFLIERYEAQPALAGLGLDIVLNVQAEMGVFNLDRIIGVTHELFDFQEEAPPLVGDKSTQRMAKLHSWLIRPLKTKHAPPPSVYFFCEQLLRDPSGLERKAFYVEDSPAGDGTYSILTQKDAVPVLSLRMQKSTDESRKEDTSWVRSPERFWHESGEALNLLKLLAALQEGISKLV